MPLSHTIYIASSSNAVDNRRISEVRCMVGGGCMPYCSARELPKILFAARGCPVFPPSRSRALSYRNLKNELYELSQACTGFRSPCFERFDSKSSISGCLLSESQAVPSDLNSNISQTE